MQCDNGITCPGPSDFISKFEVIQDDIKVTTHQELTIDGKNFTGTDDRNGHPIRSSWSVCCNDIDILPPTSSTRTTAIKASTHATTTSHSNKLKPFPKLLLALAIFFMFITQTRAHLTGQLQGTTLMLSTSIFPLFLWLFSLAQPTFGITRTFVVTTHFNTFLIKIRVSKRRSQTQPLTSHNL